MSLKFSILFFIFPARMDNFGSSRASTHFEFDLSRYRRQTVFKILCLAKIKLESCLMVWYTARICKHNPGNSLKREFWVLRLNRFLRFKFCSRIRNARDSSTPKYKLKIKNSFFFSLDRVFVFLRNFAINLWMEWKK